MAQYPNGHSQPHPPALGPKTSGPIAPASGGGYQCPRNAEGAAALPGRATGAESEKANEMSENERCPGCGGLYVMIGRVHNCRVIRPTNAEVIAAGRRPSGRPDLDAARARIAELEAEVARLEAKLAAANAGTMSTPSSVPAAVTGTPAGTGKRTDRSEYLRKHKVDARAAKRLGITVAAYRALPPGGKP